MSSSQTSRDQKTDFGRAADAFGTTSASVVYGFQTLRRYIYEVIFFFDPGFPRHVWLPAFRPSPSSLMLVYVVDIFFLIFLRCLNQKIKIINR